MKALKRLVRTILPNKVHFLIKSRIKVAHVSDQPHLDEESAEYFRERISKSQVYLEYGSGGSTIVASKNTKQMFTVESDAAFLRAVKKRLKSIAEPHSQVTLIFVNIGITEEWGIPIFKRPTKRRAARWGRYVTAPWEKLRTRGIEPDTILVDGRFRVACVLQSILNLSSRSNCFILVDDYLDRPEYRAVEEFTDIHAVYGRMVVIVKKEKFDAEGCRQRLVEYQGDWR
jgi:hypothetical protein